MNSSYVGKAVRIAMVLLTACGCGFAQYGGGTGGMGGMGGTGTYTPGSKSYGHGALIGGIAAGAGAGALFLVLHHRHAAVVGCVAQDGKTLTAENSKIYQLTGSPVTAGERVSVVGKKSKDASGVEALEVSAVKEDFGQCRQTGAVGNGGN